MAKPIKTTIITANLGVDGLKHMEGKHCVYVVLILTSPPCIYVGKTGTPNNTGVSSPFRRLASHIAKLGKTHSCIWDGVDKPAGKRKDFLSAAIEFVAVHIPDNKSKASEQWLLKQLEDDPKKRYQLLNKTKSTYSGFASVEKAVEDLKMEVLSMIKGKS